MQQPYETPEGISVMQIEKTAFFRMLKTTCVCLIALASPISGYAGITEIKQIDQIASSESQLLAVGKISKINIEKNSIEINGQDFAVDSVTEIIPSNENPPIKGPAGIITLAPGDHVAVTGEMMDAGKSLATTIVQLKDTFVDGASQAFVQVQIDGVSKETGHVTSGKSYIDYTAALHENSLEDIQLGAIARFYGITVLESFIASQALITDKEPSQIQTSGIRAGRGSGIRAGRGSGIRAGRGSGIR
jgi:hypothetical protein